MSDELLRQSLTELRSELKRLEPRRTGRVVGQTAS